MFFVGDKNEWGTWTGDQFCDKGFAVCGIKSQVEARAKDTTALNNVNLHCCPVSEDVKLTSCTPNLVAIRIDTLDNRRGKGWKLEVVWSLKVE